MQCENGYIKPGVRGILCRKAEAPTDGNLKSVAHALCGHQRFCPNQKCYTMLPGWENCTKRKGERIATTPTELRNDNTAETREEAAGRETEPQVGKPKGKKKTAKKSADGE